MKISIEDYDENLENVQRDNKKCAKIQTTICFLSLCRCLLIFTTLFMILCILLLFKTYINAILIWLEGQNNLTIAITIMVLFIIVSFPISIGYIILVVSSGYLFGIGKGLLLTICSANFGLFVAHNLLRLVRHHPAIYRFTQNDTAKAIMRVITGPLCFKIVLCARLTPIPFGLQNTIFALSNVTGRIYHIASLFGLFPAQFVGVYVGSTLRSMQDVLENSHISSTTYFFVILQLMLGATLMIWIGTKARKELLRAIAEAESSTNAKATNFSSIV